MQFRFCASRCLRESLSIAWTGSMHYRGRVIGFRAAVTANVVVFFDSQSFWLSECLMLFGGIEMISDHFDGDVAMQYLFSDTMRGRVMRLNATCFLGLPPLGVLMAGQLSRNIPTATPRR